MDGWMDWLIDWLVGWLVDGLIDWFGQGLGDKNAICVNLKFVFFKKVMEEGSMHLDIFTINFYLNIHVHSNWNGNALQYLSSFLLRVLDCIIWIWKKGC